jgi:hypothetical protein
MFKMEARLDGRKVVLRLSGRMQVTHLEQLRARIDKNTRSVALDFEEVTRYNPAPYLSESPR